jgi:hypothetical protein
LLVASAGCSGTAGTAGTAGNPSTASPKESARFETAFTRIAPRGYIDLSLEFENPTSDPVTLRGKLVARDAGGAELARVRVTTAFGTESGHAVVMPGGSVDFVQLDGPGSQFVRDVTLQGVTVSTQDVPPIRQFVNLTPLDGAGNELDYDMNAQSVRLENPNSAPARVRVVLMVLRAPQTGVPQEATLVRDVTTVDVDANGTATVELDGATRGLLQKHGLASFVTLRPVLSP